jgi:hypothetical protein
MNSSKKHIELEEILHQIKNECKSQHSTLHLFIERKIIIKKLKAFHILLFLKYTPFIK